MTCLSSNDLSETIFEHMKVKASTWSGGLVGLYSNERNMIHAVAVHLPLFEMQFKNSILSVRVSHGMAMIMLTVLYSHGLFSI